MVRIGVGGAENTHDFIAGLDRRIVDHGNDGRGAKECVHRGRQTQHFVDRPLNLCRVIADDVPLRRVL